jgi:hypothetical protein
MTTANRRRGLFRWGLPLAVGLAGAFALAVWLGGGHSAVWSFIESMSPSFASHIIGDEPRGTDVSGVAVGFMRALARPPANPPLHQSPASERSARIFVYATQPAMSDLAQVSAPAEDVAYARAIWMPIRYRDVADNLYCYELGIRRDAPRHDWPMQFTVVLKYPGHQQVVAARVDPCYAGKPQGNNLIYSNHWSTRRAPMSPSGNRVGPLASARDWQWLGMRARDGGSHAGVESLRLVPAPVLQYSKGRDPTLVAAWYPGTLASRRIKCLVRYQDGTEEVWRLTPRGRRRDAILVWELPGELQGQLPSGSF